MIELEIRVINKFNDKDHYLFTNETEVAWHMPKKGASLIGERM